MEVYVKSFSTFRTIKKATANAWELVDDSLDYETSTVTVVGDAIDRSDAGNWLILDGQIFRISNVSPESAQTVLTLESPLDAFTRPIELEAQPAIRQSVDLFRASCRRCGLPATIPFMRSRT